MNYSFETGPIRPPSEAESILLRVTRNCPWNRCTFCPVYKGEKFSLRSVDEIKQDIDSMHYIAENIFKGREELLSKDGISVNLINQMKFWMQFGMKSLFLQDADSLVMKSDRLVEILKYIKIKFPAIERITSYSRAKTLSKKSIEELKNLCEAGLNRLHVGMESGSDNVLKILDKGVTSGEQVIAGRKAIEAGFELSEFYMPGSGGVNFLRENALESARVLSEIKPHFIRIRSTIPIPGTPLHDLMTDGKWTPLTEEEKIKEIRLFIENLDAPDSIIESDHIMNLIEDIKGSDKKKILSVIDSFLNMNIDDRESFILGRRAGAYRYLSDYRKNPEVEKLKFEIKKNFNNIDEAVLKMQRNFV